MKKGRVLFIIHDVYQDFNSFPLGIGYLAAVLKKEGIEADIYCQDLYHYSNEELGEYLDQNNYDFIGISFMAARFKETVLELCHVVNRHKKNAWLVLGGFGPSPIPEYILETTQADIVAIGEAEETIVEIVKEKLNGTCKLEKIKGIAYRDKNTVKINPRRGPVMNVDSIPFPAWELFPMQDYGSSMKILSEQPPEGKSLVIYTSRGCINRCNFCYRMEKGVRVRSIDNIIEELKILVNVYGIRYFQVYDEMFILNKKRLLEFEEKLAKNKLEIFFFCNSRVDIFDKEMVECLKRCGCRFINFGIESVSDQVLKAMNKNTTVEENIKAVETVLSVGGIGIGLNILWGNLKDTEETLFKGVEFIKKYNTYKQVRTIRPPTPYPGSDLYELALQKGLLKGPADFFEKFKNSDLYLINFTDMPIKRFYELLFKANKELVLDHYTKSQGNMQEADNLIQEFSDLYLGKNTGFRGARKYLNENRKN